MNVHDTISDAIREELRGRDDDVSDRTIEAIAQNVEKTLRADGLLPEETS